MEESTMVWRELWKTAFSSEAPFHHFHPITGSLLFFSSTFVVWYTLVVIIKRLSPNPLREYFLDFLGSFLTCACSFENGNAVRMYGWPALFLVIFSLMMIYSNIFTDSCPNPVGNLQKYFQRRQSFLKTVIKVLIQALAGFASYEFVKLFWSLDFHEYHHIKRRELCFSYLSVPVLVGMLLEGGATLIDLLLNAYNLAPWKQVNNVMRCSLETAMVIAGIQLTGMYFHPAMASAQTFGCRGTQIWEHLVVYWAGPFIGCFIGVKINSLVRNAIKTERKPRSQKQKSRKSTNGDVITVKQDTRQNVATSTTNSNGARKRNNKSLNNNVSKEK